MWVETGSNIQFLRLHAVTPKSLYFALHLDESLLSDNVPELSMKDILHDCANQRFSNINSNIRNLFFFSTNAAFRRKKKSYKFWFLSYHFEKKKVSERKMSFKLLTYST